MTKILGTVGMDYRSGSDRIPAVGNHTEMASHPFSDGLGNSSATLHDIAAACSEDPPQDYGIACFSCISFHVPTVSMLPMDGKIQEARSLCRLLPLWPFPTQLVLGFCDIGCVLGGHVSSALGWIKHIHLCREIKKADGMMRFAVAYRKSAACCIFSGASDLLLCLL
jgi:hypothetical protein